MRRLYRRQRPATPPAPAAMANNPGTAAGWLATFAEPQAADSAVATGATLDHAAPAGNPDGAAMLPGKAVRLRRGDYAPLPGRPGRSGVPEHPSAPPAAP